MPTPTAKPGTLPAASGAYLLHVTLPAPLRLVVRRRRPSGLTPPRTFRLPAGEYVYVGSAFGPGGLAARVGRHLAPGSHPLHWDVDFLLAALARRARFEAWGQATEDRGAECRWAGALSRRAGTSPVVGVRHGGGPSGFGAGDCQRRCGCAPGAPDAARTHLFRLAGRVTRTGVGRCLGVALAALGRSAPAGGRAVTRRGQGRPGDRPRTGPRRG